MTEEEKWKEEAHKAFEDRKLDQYHYHAMASIYCLSSEHDFTVGYLQTCRKRQGEINELKIKIKNLEEYKESWCKQFP